MKFTEALTWCYHNQCHHNNHMPISLVPTEGTSAASLNQGVIRTRKNSLGLLQCINLIRAGLLPDGVVLNEPIAISMEISDILFCGHELILLRRFVVLVLHGVSLKPCLGRLLVRD